MFRITKLLVCWLVGLLLVSYIGSRTFIPNLNNGLGSPQNGQNFSFYKSLAQWDGGNYIYISQNGYDQTKYFAFAPIYPILIMFFAQIVKNQITAGLIISFSATILFFNIYFLYLKEKLSANIARDTIFTFLFFPTTFFMVFVYSESLFLATVALALYFFEKKNYKAAAIFTGFAGLTRFIGVFLALSFITSLVKKRSWSEIPFFIVSFLPITLFSLTLFLFYSDPLLFVSVESDWQRFIQNPLTTITNTASDIFINKNTNISTIFDLISTVSFIALLIAGIKKIPTYLWAFSAFALLIPASTGTLTSMPRYVLASLGTYTIAAIYVQNHKILKIVIWSIMLAVQAYFAARFVTGYWVA